MKRLLKRNRKGCLMTFVLLILLVIAGVKLLNRETIKPPTPTSTGNGGNIYYVTEETIWPTLTAQTEEAYFCQCGTVILETGQLFRSSPYFLKDNILGTVAYLEEVEILGITENQSWYKVRVFGTQLVGQGDMTIPFDPMDGYMHVDHLELVEGTTIRQLLP